MRNKLPVLHYAAALLLALVLPCQGQLMYYNQANNSVYTDKPFTTAGILAAGTILNAPNIYTSGWFRNNNNQNGLHAQAYGAYFYPSNSSEWTIGGGDTYQRMLFRDTYEGTLRGYIYSDGSGFGFLGSTGNWVIYSSYGSQTLNLPSAGGMQLGVGNTIRSTPSNYGSIGFDTAKNGWYGLLMGQDNTKDNVMCDGSGNCGLYVESKGAWQNYWDNAARTWNINGTFRTEAGYQLRSAGRRVLSEVVVTEVAMGQSGTCIAPSCPGGSADQTGGNGTAMGNMCYRHCLFGNISGWGGYVP